MKKLKGVLTAFCVCLLCLLMLTACSSELSAPAGVRLDEATLVLHWNKVSSASAYVVEIADGISYTTREHSYSLENLEPGEYVIKIRAVSYNQDVEDSETVTYHFTREEESGLEYELSANRDSYTLVGIGKANGDVVMEDYYRGKPVTAIGKAALRRCNEITSFVVGNNVTTIGDNAFYACIEMTSITLPEGLQSIGEGAFQSCTKLETIAIPDGITTVAPYTFSMCKSLREVELSPNVTGIGMYAFSDCQVMQTVTMPDKVTYVEEYAFSGCKALSQVNFSENLKTIGTYAFYTCTALKEVTFNSALEEIGYGAFTESGLTSVTLPESLITLGHYAFASCVDLESASINANLTSIGYHAFTDTAMVNNCTEDVLIVDSWVITAVTLKTDDTRTLYEIPEGVIGIANGAFYACQYIQRFKLDGVKYIGEQAFGCCSNLWEVLCGNSLLHIGRYAFYLCDKLTNVDVGNKLEYIDDYAFFMCEDLEDAGITLPRSLKQIGTGSFNGTRIFYGSSDGLVYVDDWVVGAWTNAFYFGAYVREGTRGICNYAFQYSQFLDAQLYLPDSVEIIGKGAFYKNPTVYTLNMPKNLKYIGDYAFADTYVMFAENGVTIIPEGCEYLGECAFRNCSRVATLSIPGTVKHIGNYAFMGCTALGMLMVDENDPSVVVFDATVTLHEGIESIGKRAFYGCDALRSIVLPNSLQDLGERAFYKCTSLQTIDFGTGVDEIKPYTFYNCTSLQEITIPGNIRTIGRYAFRGCTGVETITLCEGVEKVDDYAFTRCEEVKYLSIADSVAYIGSFAFRGMPHLEAIHISEFVTYVGRLAFYGANNATIYYEGTQIPETWDARWNASYRPVVLKAVLSEDNAYVISWTAYENGILNLSEYTLPTAPSKDGFVFVGWSTTQDGEAGQYAVLSDVPAGTTVYPVWNVYVEEAPEQSETTDQNEN